MAGQDDFPEHLTDIQASFTVPDYVLEEFTVNEVVLVESLKTPGLQTTIKAHSYLRTIPNKNLDTFKNAVASFEFTRPILQKFGLPHVMRVRQRVYRISNRKLIDNNNEEYTIHCCDDSLLNDARVLVSDAWKCTEPSKVVSDVLTNCVGVPPDQQDIENSSPARDYIAENIHPFQVVSQQADVALASGNDPSFVHFMTYEPEQGKGIHHFRSLYSMTRENQINSIPFQYNELGDSSDGSPQYLGYTGYKNPYAIMTYSFPCDFDLLSDLLNGIDVDGKEISSLTSINPLAKQAAVLGNKAIGCGIGGGVYKYGLSNKNTEQQQDSCNIDIENHLLKRQARMNLLEEDKVALRITMPWCPWYHAGKVIEIVLINKTDAGFMMKEPLYGSGKYLISTMVHTIKRGGYSTTTMDCVSVTTGKGIV